MRLSRLGSLHQCRLSFMRQLTRRMAAEGWRFERREWAVGANGTGHAVLCAHGPERSYSLVAFAHDLPDAARSDRVIAEAWDTTFALHDGVPDADAVARLAGNVPRQEAGRVEETELCLSRANRSVRLWEHVVGALAAGRQPDPAQLDAVGYLMRTTAVYGSGKFGAADRERIAGRPEMAAPFQAEMLCVYLIRAFVRDLVEHHARMRGPDAVPLDPALARRLGIGNSTGLGMAPFLVNHPELVSHWVAAREAAAARVRSVRRATEAEVALFRDVLARAAEGVALWRSDHPLQQGKLERLRADMDALRARAAAPFGARPWDALVRWGEGAMSEEGQEMLVSLMLEPYPRLVDPLGPAMACARPAVNRIDGGMPVGALRRRLRERFGWAEGTDWDDPSACARVWYVSEEKLEPRLGERHAEPLEPYEQPLAPARDAWAALRALEAWDDRAPVAGFLLAHPEHRHTVRRAQLHAPYGELRGNTIAADLLPIDMLRAKLSFFGATRFDPRSDRWVRICLFPHAPYPEEIHAMDPDRWIYG
ncbi:hypothetical protein [Jannaschia sp. W003]|uniref:hypothetical protein n=1 Tax=Jannaschia sp. W003 TaxID=2867012 RepID=UPI0021A53E28|nr:hypothetical protein [Jannaschia sp. W003]UWQ22955.1 hypothetical protein K3554_00195 [Jannaschia sp. W003]